MKNLNRAGVDDNMKKKFLFWIAGLFLIFSLTSGLGYAGLPFTKLKLDSKSPLTISLYDQGVFHPMSLPVDFSLEAERDYDYISIQDIDANGTEEVVFHLAGNGVNSCYRMLYFSQDDRILKEMDFKYGGLCNFKLRRGYIISTYKEGAIWKEDVYFAKNGMTQAVLSDSCVGCNKVARKKYDSDGSFVRSLVSDSVDFENRTPVIAKVASITAEIFFSPDKTRSAATYLVQGDEITFIGFDQSEDGEEWIEFRFSERSSSIEGWLRCRDLEGCMSN
jgi:hypothetical protein